MALAILLAAAAGPTAAQTELSGVWKTGERGGSWGLVEFRPCGPAICGVLVGGGGKDVNPSHFGTRIIAGMTRQAKGYSGGRIYDPENDRWFASRMELTAPDRLAVSGCVLGGLLCGTQVWQRRK